MTSEQHDLFNLSRFVMAQQSVYATALSELKAGAKRTHWMWFVFPQAEGLGHSAMAQRYAIRSPDEAVAYIAHPLLGTRLAECTRAVCSVSGKSAHEIFGAPDDVKFRSSMTLFDTIVGGALYREALQHFFDGEADSRTLAIIDNWRRGTT